MEPEEAAQLLLQVSCSFFGEDNSLPVPVIVQNQESEENFYSWDGNCDNPVGISVVIQGDAASPGGVSSEPFQCEGEDHQEAADDLARLPLTESHEEAASTNYSDKRRAGVDRAKRLSVFEFKNQALRVAGKTYQAIDKKEDEPKLVFRDERSMKPPCPQTARCRKGRGKLFKCAALSEAEREINFKKFWALGKWEEKIMYVKTLVSSSPPLRSSAHKRSENNNSNKYYLYDHSGQKVRVCLSNFCGTFGVSKRTIQQWLAPKKPAARKSTQVDQPRRKKYHEKLTRLKVLLERLPRVPSHYSRATDDKCYLDPSWPSLRRMYRWYSKIESDHVSWPTFLKTMKQQKLKLFKWRKDRCNLCEEMRLNKIPIPTSEHFIESRKAFLAKRRLKLDLRRNQEVSAFVMDMQAALPVPRLQVDASYFRLKLLLHNMTFIDLRSKDVDCFVFTELDAGATADVYSSCIEEQIRATLDLNPKTKELHIFSDSCLAQNKNCTLSNILLSLAIELEISITHHYLVVGHTHLEVDTYHSVVEKYIRNQELHNLQDYVTCFKSALVEDEGKKSEVRVHQVDRSFFKKYHFKYLKSIRPGRKTGDPTVAQTRAFRYLPDGKVEYKLLEDDEFQPLPQVISLKEFDSPTPLYNSPLTISENKKQHLRELLPYVPEEKKDFYNFL